MTRHLSWSATTQQELQGNLDNLEAFLNLKIKMENGKLTVSLFDITDNFSFCIVRMPPESSRLPSDIIYFAIGAET